MPRVCFFLYFIIKTKKPRVCSRGKKSICGEIFFSRTHELSLLTNPINERALLTLLNLLTNSRYSTYSRTPLTLSTYYIYTQPTIYIYIYIQNIVDWTSCTALVSTRFGVCILQRDSGCRFASWCGCTREIGRTRYCTGIVYLEPVWATAYKELIWQAIIIKYECMRVCMSVSVSVSVCRS
jgi:hypothetical protein